MPSKFTIHFYKTEAGREPTKEYLLSLKNSKDPNDNALFEVIVTYLKLLSERGTSLEMPYSKHLAKKLWELRPKNNRIIYCCIQGSHIYLLHNFKKQTQKTPLKEIKLALKRYKKLTSD